MLFSSFFADREDSLTFLMRSSNEKFGFDNV